MHTVFIVNPKAGQGDKFEQLIDRINNLSYDSTVYLTESEGDATVFVSKYCQSHGPARFIACGGDGTLNEVLNGAFGIEGAQIGVLPIGTGNDFCRNFAKNSDFSDLCLQIESDCIKCDAIKYSITSCDTIKTGYCANMFNIGFDCNVAYKTASLKTKPFISGSFAYLLSIFINLIKKTPTNLTIELDGQQKYSGELLLASVANGSFCGGGIMSNPMASPTDGYININIISNLSRLKFIRLLPYYIKGTHLDLPNIGDIIKAYKCHNLKIHPNIGPVKLCVDGEIISAEDIEFEIVHDAFDFVIPSHCKDDDCKKCTKANAL